MKQIVQDLKTGSIELVDVPCPQNRPGHLLVRSSVSLISPGTEKMLLEFGKAGLLQKARQQPDKVRQAFDKIKTDGLMPTIDAIRGKLDMPMAMGYCNVGTVLEVGPGVSEFCAGDRVVSNGKHAEIVSVPRNLCAKIPESVGNTEGAFTVIGAIALQGMRLAQPTLGESFVVMGLGLVGLLAVQLLIANGCRVLATDIVPQRLEIARRFGADTVLVSKGGDLPGAARVFSRGRGVDGVIIAASTRSNDPVRQAAHMCRKRGRIVLIGVVGLELSRADFYEKEISFQVSCSYGPGRYDPAYEDGGHDYPAAFVRWTEQRNFEAVLDMMAGKHIDVSPLVSLDFPISEAEQAYKSIGDQSCLGILLHYPEGSEVERNTLAASIPIGARSAAEPGTGKTVIGFIGAGSHASRVLIPGFKKQPVSLKSIASATGLSGAHLGQKFGFRETTTDTGRLFDDREIDAIVIATRHDSHAKLVCDGLRAKKHVFVEKPLALTRGQLAEIESTYLSVASQNPGAPLLMVGFNRRFAPHTVKIKSLLDSVSEPKSFIMTVNAGYVPPEHWTRQKETGGGRIIGEACHFIDLLRFLAASPITAVKTVRMGSSPGAAAPDDTISFSLAFENGSFGTVHYLANGHKSFPKERLEVFCAGRILQLDNFRKLRGYGWPGFGKMNLWRQDKGFDACIEAFMSAVRNGLPELIPFRELAEVTRVSFEIAESLGGS